MPKVKLHPTNILKLQAHDGRRTDYRDEVLPGLVLRVSPTGGRTFTVEYWRQDKKARYTLGPVPPLNLGEAREAARQVLARLHIEGKDPHAARLEERQRIATQPTVRELADRCLGAIQVRPATLASYQRIVTGVIELGIGHRPAAELRRAELRAFLEPIAKRTPVHANRVLAVLKRVYSWALEQDILEASPCAGIRPPGGREAPSSRVLSTDELRALLQALDALEGGMAPLAAATRLLLLTGLRESAVLGLRRGDLVDADSPEPRLVIPPERPGTKARQGRGRAHVVPLAPAALAVVQARLEATQTDHLFPQARLSRDEPMLWNFELMQVLRYQVGLAWVEQHGLELPKTKKRQVDVKAVRQLMPRWTAHNLRHTLATHMRERLRVGRDVVAVILGHQQGGGSQATAIYDRSELLPERRAALVAWAAWLEQVRKGEERGARVLPMGVRDRDSWPQPGPGESAMDGNSAK